MARERVLIIGGGISGLAAAGFLSPRFDCLLAEREAELGGYCRTVYRDGFTWDYSGHFFHFRHKWIADYVHSRMDTAGLMAIHRRSRIYLRNEYIEYPFQFNIHQLPLRDFLHCLTEMYAASQASGRKFSSFQDMVYGRYGRTLSDLFLIPYNEKLYSVPAAKLDADCMGRFFPHTDFGALLGRINAAIDGGNYNATFSYHRSGARAYVDALAAYVPSDVIRLSANCEAIDTGKKQAMISGERVSYDRLVISAPLPAILRLVGSPAPEGLLTANKVLVFNLGFDRPSSRPDHWVYYPEPEWVFFRVGHYDNILGQNRMSLYVEVALAQGEQADVDGILPVVLADLQRAGVIDGHRLVSHNTVLLDPAYVHVSMESERFVQQACTQLRSEGIFPIGRYGNWTYCSIEDNIIQAHDLARDWGCPPLS
jgi:protoporphyrinogen oxidase